MFSGRKKGELHDEDDTDRKPPPEA